MIVLHMNSWQEATSRDYSACKIIRQSQTSKSKTEEYGDEAEYLRVFIGRLRRKLERDPSHPEYLVTEPGVGYKFVPRY